MRLNETGRRTSREGAEGRGRGRRCELTSNLYFLSSPPKDLLVDTSSRTILRVRCERREGDMVVGGARWGLGVEEKGREEGRKGRRSGGRDSRSRRGALVVTFPRKRCGKDYRDREF